MQLLNGLILLALIAGQTEILVAMVNRSHSLRVGPAWLKRFRHIHDLLLVLFPPVLIGWVGFYSPGVLTGGSWRDLSLPWRVWLTACALGFVSLVVHALRWQFRPQPRSLVAQSSDVTNLGQGTNGRMTGSGQYQFLTKIPRNEFLQVELSRKTFELPRLGIPELRILHLTDFHFTGIPNVDFYEQAIRQAAAAEQYDLIFFTGDLLDEEGLTDWIPRTLSQLSARLGCYYILGNHDWAFGDLPVRSALNELGWIDVGGRVVEIPVGDSLLAVGGSEYPWMGQHPEFSSVSLTATRLLLSHTPDNLPWAREHDVDFMFSGHNHGGQVVLPVLGPVYAPSWRGVRYASGSFHEEPTLLHVCRGLGARHPLRLNCRPEIAIIVLRESHSPSDMPACRPA